MRMSINTMRYLKLLFLFFLIGGVGYAHALQVPGPLVETDWLAQNLDKVVVLDVRVSPVSFEKKIRGSKAAVNPCGVSSKKKKPIIVSGHIPGAVLVVYKDVTEKRKIDGEERMNLVLSKSAFEKLMQKSGVSNDSAVVITGTGKNTSHVLIATQLYWMMKYYGHDNVTLLNGGVKKWIEEKRDIKYGKSRPKKTAYKASEPRPELIATTEEVAKAVKDGSIQLVDGRNLEDYIGMTYDRKFTSADRRGHIPGAKLWPAASMVDTKGTAVFYSTDELRELAKVLNVDVDKPSITYCWSGGFASLDWYVMHELLGNKDVSMYDGSMHVWSKDPNNPMVKMKLPQFD